MKFTAFKEYYGFFQKFIGHRILFLGGISFVTTMIEGLGIALFFSYIQLLSTPGAPTTDLIQKLEKIFLDYDIAFSMTSVMTTVILLFILRGTFILIQNSYHYRLYMQLTQGLTRTVAKTLTQLSYVEFTQKDTGEYAHIATKEVERSVTAFYQISAILPKIIVISTYMVLSLKFEWRFTVAGLVFGALIQLIYKVVSAKTKKLSVQMSAFESRLTSTMIQMIQAFKYLISTSNTETFQKRVNHLSGNVAQTGSKIGMLGATIVATSEPLIIIFLCLCIYYQTQVLHASWTSLFVAIMFLYRTMKELTVMQGSWQAFVSYSNGVDRIREFLKLKGNPIDERNHGVPVPQFKNQIKATNLGCTLGNKTVLHQVNFEIKKNQTVAFVGESGAGKSTVINLITGIIQPSTGEMSMDGVSYSDMNLKKLRQKMGYVTQENVIFDGTVAENVTLWASPETFDAKKVEQSLQVSGADQFVQELKQKTDEPVGDRGVKLSGGQRQRIALSREIYRDPEILILDEATSALDSESEFHIQKQIENLKGKATIILVAHRLSTIKNCDYIYVLEKGKVVQSGTFEQLSKTDGSFSRMINLQSLN